jgi:hypothetical protein
MAHQFGRGRLRALNARAVEDNVNLAITLDVADPATREWVARNALPHAPLRSRWRSSDGNGRQNRCWSISLPLFSRERRQRDQGQSAASPRT